MATTKYVDLNGLSRFKANLQSLISTNLGDLKFYKYEGQSGLTFLFLYSGNYNYGTLIDENSFGYYLSNLLFYLSMLKTQTGIDTSINSGSMSSTLKSYFSKLLGALTENNFCICNYNSISVYFNHNSNYVNVLFGDGTIIMYQVSNNVETISFNKSNTYHAGNNISIANDGTINATYSEASASASGLMSINDKSKLDSITPSLYALKTELSGLTKFKIEVIPSGSTHTSVSEPDRETIYLERDGGTSPNLYSEYIYIEGENGASGTWELLGKQNIDLTGYVKADTLFESANGYVVSSSGNTYLDFAQNKSFSEYTGGGYLEIFFRQNGSVDGNNTPTGGINSVKTMVHDNSGTITMDPIQLLLWSYDLSNTTLSLTACIASKVNDNRLTFSNAENADFSFTIYRVVGYK